MRLIRITTTKKYWRRRGKWNLEETQIKSQIVCVPSEIGRLKTTHNHTAWIWIGWFSGSLRGLWFFRMYIHTQPIQQMHEIQRNTPNSDGFIRRVSKNHRMFRKFIIIDRSMCIKANIDTKRQTIIYRRDLLLFDVQCGRWRRQIGDEKHTFGKNL